MLNIVEVKVLKDLYNSLYNEDNTSLCVHLDCGERCRCEVGLRVVISEVSFFKELESIADRRTPGFGTAYDDMYIQLYGYINKINKNEMSIGDFLHEIEEGYVEIFNYPEFVESLSPYLSFCSYKDIPLVGLSIRKGISLLKMKFFDLHTLLNTMPDKLMADVRVYQCKVNEDGKECYYLVLIDKFSSYFIGEWVNSRKLVETRIIDRFISRVSSIIKNSKLFAGSAYPVIHIEDNSGIPTLYIYESGNVRAYSYGASSKSEEQLEADKLMKGIIRALPKDRCVSCIGIFSLSPTELYEASNPVNGERIFRLV